MDVWLCHWIKVKRSYFCFLPPRIIAKIIFPSSLPLLNVTSAAGAVQVLTSVLASEICGTAQTYCNETNTQYTDMASCYAYLTQEVRFGEAYELGRNTLLCRSVHQNMVPYRPGVHWWIPLFSSTCLNIADIMFWSPHIGPTGGGMCTDDTTYLGTVEANFFDIPMIPHGH